MPVKLLIQFHIPIAYYDDDPKYVRMEVIRNLQRNSRAVAGLFQEIDAVIVMVNRNSRMVRIVQIDINQ